MTKTGSEQLPEGVVKRIKSPEYLDFSLCPKCGGNGMVLYDAYKGVAGTVTKRKLCDVCGGQAVTMAQHTREEIKQLLGGDVDV